VIDAVADLAAYSGVMRIGIERGAAILALAIALAGCSTTGSAPTTVNLPPLPGSPTVPAEEPLPELDPNSIAAGEELYGRFCASCHGADLEGDPDWKTPNGDGSYRPPPQDGSGHTWHHGDDLLVSIILDGSAFDQSRMPRFTGQLTEAEVLSILEFFKSTWGSEERGFQWGVTVRDRSGT